MLISKRVLVAASAICDLCLPHALFAADAPGRKPRLPANPAGMTIYLLRQDKRRGKKGCIDIAVTSSLTAPAYPSNRRLLLFSATTDEAGAYQGKPLYLGSIQHPVDTSATTWAVSGTRQRRRQRPVRRSFFSLRASPRAFRVHQHKPS